VSWIERARRALRRPDEVVLPEVSPEVADEVVPALLARAADSDSVVLAQGVPLDGVHVGFDPGEGDSPGVLVAVRVMGDGSMHVVRLETAQPAGWLTNEQLAEMRSRANEAMPDYLELVSQTELDGQMTVLDALREITADKRRQDLDPFGEDYWAEVDSAGERARAQQANAGQVDVPNPDAGPLDPEGASIMTMHYVPAGADPAVTVCCGLYVEDVPAVEGFVRTRGACTCPVQAARDRDVAAGWARAIRDADSAG
jgi:hypothetical protein